MTGIILAAGSGRRIKINKPKGMLNIGGQPLIEYSIQSLKKAGVDQIILVTGFHSEIYETYFSNRTDVQLVHNAEYANCGSLHSLSTALSALEVDDDIVILDSDILYNWNEFQHFMNSRHRNSLLATNVPEGRNDACYIEVDIAGHLVKVSKNINCVNLGNDEPWEYIGITRSSRESLEQIRAYIDEKYTSTGSIDHEYDYAFESISSKYHVIKYPDYIWSEADDNQQLVYMVNIVYPKINLC
jgi:choline kinase